MRSPKVIVGGALVSLFAVVALVSFVWTPADPTAIDMVHRLVPPGGGHLLGTDRYGRDVLSLIMAGGRTTLFVALAAVGLGAALGLPIGLWSAARRGLADQVLMRTSDIVFAFPAVLTAVLLSASLGPGAKSAVLAIGLFNIPVFAKTARGLALVQWQLPYVSAAKVAGKNALDISFEHVLPNIVPGLAAQAAVQFSTAIVAETGLSFIGLGVQPPVPSWGRLLSEAQTLIDIAPFLAIVPGVAIVLAVLGFNLLGEGLSDHFSPRGGD